MKDGRFHKHSLTLAMDRLLAVGVSGQRLSPDTSLLVTPIIHLIREIGQPR